MARRSKRLNIDKKYKGDRLYSAEFNEVVDTINDLVDDVAENEANDNLNTEIISSYVTSYVGEVTSYIESYVSPSIDELLIRSSELLGLTTSNKNSIDALLEQSATLLGVSQNHETRITTAEELLAASQELLNEINGRTAYDIPSTNGNVQQDIDSLLSESRRLLGIINDVKDDSYSYINTKIIDVKEQCYTHTNTSYNRMYSYVEDTTLTFTIEGMKNNTQV